ncbi:WD40-repeat-containing domain protein [Globomyces pollinis-pini]|nr:WD40-repeat-containing domain protein [Globomyces pollinis-pini]
MTSEYERKRLENIKENNRILKELGLDVVDMSSPAKPKPKPKPKTTPKRKADESPLPRRVSLRNRGQDPDGSERKELAEVIEIQRQKENEERSRLVGTIKVEASEDFQSLHERSNKESLFDLKPKSVSNFVNVIPDGSVKIVPDMIYCIAFNPFSNNLMSVQGGKSGNIVFWDIEKSLEQIETNPDELLDPVIHTFKPHVAPVYKLQYLDSNSLFSCSVDGSIRKMDIVKGQFDEVYVHPDEVSINYFDLVKQGGWFSTSQGEIGQFDLRKRLGSLKATYLASSKKINTVHVNPRHEHLLCTAGLDGTVRIFDVRNLKSSEDLIDPLLSFQHSKSVNSAFWDPTGTDIISTSFDDTLNLWKSAHSDNSQHIKIRHNNNTGRWIQKFKAEWDKQNILIGNMKRSVDIFNNQGDLESKLEETVTAIPAVNVGHPTLPLILSGNGSGKMMLWK